MLNLSAHDAHCINMKDVSEQNEEARQYLIDSILHKDGFVTPHDRQSKNGKARMEFLQSKPFSYLEKANEES